MRFFKTVSVKSLNSKNFSEENFSFNETVRFTMGISVADAFITLGRSKSLGKYS